MPGKRYMSAGGNSHSGEPNLLKWMELCKKSLFLILNGFNMLQSY